MHTATGFALLALLLAGCSSEPARKSDSPRAAIPAGERLVVRATATPVVKAVSGEITTVDQAEARARISGVLDRLLIKRGDTVRAGQPIGHVTDSRLAEEGGARAAEVAAASAHAVAAESELKRIRFLYDNGVYAQARLDQAIAEARAARAGAEAARRQGAAVGAVAGQGVILSPASGRVLRADVPQGSAVAPGMSVATITAGAPVVRIEVPESLAANIKVGARAEVEDAGISGRAVVGRIGIVYPAVDGGRIRADVIVPGLDSRFIGRRVAARIRIGERSALIVPRRFIATRFGIDYATELTKDAAATVPVQTAPAVGDAVEILAGVSPGDTLIAAGPSA